NLAIIRHFALNLIKQDKTRKIGVKGSRKRAGWDDDYMLRLLGL
ncbi:MAG: ISAs1 family transposase, partial [Thermodesulfobacteriota bacterium]|nr:ISAs1 family transposase [Thermodesulfobacteriota bacterium]